MKLRNIFCGISSVLLIVGASACTDLTETVYDKIVSDNYYQNKEDVVRAFLRPFEHGYWSVLSAYRLQEITADQMGTWERDGWWYDGGQWERLHKHTWGLEGGDADIIANAWEVQFQGIGQCNSVLEDFARLNCEQLGVNEQELNSMYAQIRTLRAWFYLRAFDLFRNLPRVVSFNDPSQNTSYQVSPEETFAFIESELLDVIDKLPIKEGNNGNGNLQGQWNKASAAALLVRLYLNAEKWIGIPKYEECASYAQKIINGEYGNYSLAEQWYEPFDWDNEFSNEVLYAFTAGFGYSHWHWDGDMYWWGFPVNAKYYFGFLEWGDCNPARAVQPSLDVDGNLYEFELGKTIHNFKMYPEDYRLKKYVNLEGESKREGMFLYGYLPYTNSSGEVEYVTSPVGGYRLYIRDQVGRFEDAAPDEIIEDKESNCAHGDMNSGWCVVKYPVYRDGDPGAMESDYVEIRLSEIYYSLAECYFRAGNVAEAGKLLNAVRKRNYPQTRWQEYLYEPEGIVALTEAELLSEWGREFLNEGRRRTDLCRWNKYSSGTWWDKEPDLDDHTDIFIFPYRILGANPELKQNPGYPDRK